MEYQSLTPHFEFLGLYLDIKILSKWKLFAQKMKILIKHIEIQAQKLKMQKS